VKASTIVRFESRSLAQEFAGQRPSQLAQAHTDPEVEAGMRQTKTLHPGERTARMPGQSLLLLGRHLDGVRILGQHTWEDEAFDVPRAVRALGFQQGGEPFMGAGTGQLHVPV